MAGIELTFLRPWWLLGLPVLVMAGWWLHGRAGGLGAWQKAAQPQLLAALDKLGWVQSGTSRAALLAFLWTCAMVLLALSGPATERRDTSSFRNLDGVIMVADASKSVTEDARWPQMSAAMRFAILALQSRPAGLILFAGDAYAATDLTLDHHQLGQTVSLIDANTVPDPGSSPERGLALALEIINQAGIIAGDVILFTDGAGLGANTLAVTEALASRNARLSIVSMAEPNPVLQSHAKAGGGRLFGLNDPSRLSAWLQENARTRLEAQDYPLLFWQDHGRVLLFLALFPLMFTFRKRGQ